MSIISILGFVVVSFQNCSQIEFTSNDKVGQNNCTVEPCGDPTPPPPTPPPPPGPTPLADTFSKTFSSPSNKVDILIVDDNSGSMAEEQQNLGSRFNNFITNLGSIDWQVAVTSTDVCLPGNFLCGRTTGARGQFFAPLGDTPMYGTQHILTPLTPNVNSVFTSIVQRSDEEGSGDERGIYAANLVIDNRETTSKGFFRDGADFAIIVVSDENERSVGGLYPNDSQYKPLESYDLPDTLIKKVNDTWEGKKSLLVNAIVNTGETGCNRDKRNGTIYMEAAKKTNGIIGCAQDNGNGAYTEMITNIGKNIQTQNLKIVLNHTPIAEPVVTWTPAQNAVQVKWTPGTNSLVLSSYPLDGTKVDITYQYLP